MWPLDENTSSGPPMQQQVPRAQVPRWAPGLVAGPVRKNGRALELLEEGGNALCAVRVRRSRKPGAFVTAASWPVLAAATLGFGVINLDVSVVNVAVKPIDAALGGGITGLQWVVDAYTVTFAALILSPGALATGRPQAGAASGFAVFIPASAACGRSGRRRADRRPGGAGRGRGGARRVLAGADRPRLPGQAGGPGP